MNELTTNNSKEGELISDNIKNNQFFFSIQKLINKVGVQKYKETSKILLLSCTEEQIEQLNEEKRELTQLVRAAIAKNPYEIEAIDDLYGDSYTDFIKGVLSKGEEFVTKVVNFDEETHRSLNRGMQNELFGYCIPYVTDKKELDLTQKRMQKQVNDANNFLEALEKCEELSDSYKEKLKIGVNYLIDSGNKLINGEIDQNFDIETLKSNVFLLDKIEEFARPVFLKVGLKNGLAHAGWENLISDHQRYQQTQEFIDKFNFKELMKPFDSKYLVSRENGDIESLRELADNFENNFDNILQNARLESKNKTKPRKIKL